MVRLLLSIKADLENVTNLVPASDDYEYFFGVKCTSCHETHPKIVSLNRREEHPVTTGKDNTAHFVWRCGFCRRESFAKFEQSSPPQPYSADSSGQFSPFVTIDCRGLEFISFDPNLDGIWKCVGVDKETPFTEVTFEDGEWVDYDERAKVSVGILNFESEWSSA
ncbi:hypothetical protein EDB84DRAFT_1586496 [Lactarius hengduanensis]|nr:hypothetical protein EDB84DRAFT_1586496 [Lactarius hengduanensis]